MNFFGVGPAELIVILVVALVFVGPERLPHLAADLARTIREIRKYTGSLAAEFNEVIHDFERETETDRSQWKEIGEGLTGATQSVTDAIRGARADAATGGPPAATRSPATPPVDAAPVAPVDAVWHEIPEPTAVATANGQSPASNHEGALAPAEAEQATGAQPAVQAAPPLNGSSQTAAAVTPEESR